MKKSLIYTLMLLSIGFNSMAQSKVKSKQNAKNTTALNSLDSVSYSLGAMYGHSLKSFEVSDLNYDLMAKGLKEAIEGGNPLINDTQIKTVTDRYILAQKTKVNAKVKVANQKFLEENKSKNKNIKVTASGLQYEVLKEGTGKHPSDTSTVKVNYIGKLINGVEFDNSYKRNQAASIKLNNVIKGWTEGLLMMNTGAKYRLYIPYELAYGENGKPNVIPPYSTIIFDVELLEFK